MVDLITLEGLRSMPTEFRVEMLTRQPIDSKFYRVEARLYNDRASISVAYTVKQPDTRLKVGSLVSPRYCGRAICQGGKIEIARLVILELPIRSLDLFQTVPHAWVPNRALLQRASALWGKLPLPWQELFNNVVWKPSIFYHLCTGPSSISGHHSELNGNIRHLVETGEAVLALLPAYPSANPDIALAAGMLHDVGKAAEYKPGPDGGWEMTNQGKLIGHKQLIGDWLSEAKCRMRLALPHNHYVSFRHAIGAAKGVSFESGYRTPKTPEARIVSLADQSSGGGDLYARQSDPEGGWGTPHPHLGGEAPFTVARGSIMSGDRAGG